MFTSQKKKSEKPKVSCIFECRVVDSPRSNDCLLKNLRPENCFNTATQLCVEKSGNCTILKQNHPSKNNLGHINTPKYLKLISPFY